jgi:hypothetical protein
LCQPKMSALVGFPRQREKIICCYPAIAACHVRQQALAKLAID